MINEDDTNRQHQILVKQADATAREAFHYMAQELPEQYAVMQAFAEDHPETLRRFIHAIYISGFRNGQEAMHAVLKAAAESETQTKN